MVSIRIDLRGEIPFAPFKLLGDLIFPIFEKPCPGDQTGGGNDQKNDEADTEDSKLKLLQTRCSQLTLEFSRRLAVNAMKRGLAKRQALDNIFTTGKLNLTLRFERQ